MLPQAVTNAMAVYENAWHDFLRRGFFLQIRPYKDNPSCQTPGVSEHVLRSGIRVAAKERGIPFIVGYGPNPDHVMAFGSDWQTTATGYELTIPRRRNTERIQALARLMHPSTEGNRWTADRREGRTVLDVRTSTYGTKDPRVFKVAGTRWEALTRALATNNEIRAQMGLPPFTPEVTAQLRAA